MLHPLLAARWSPTTFDASDELTAAETEALLEAARWAPSAGNSQPWAFIVGQRGDATHARLVRYLARSSGAWAPAASLLIANLAHRYVEGTDWEYSEFSLYDLGQAVAHMTVQAQALGLHVRQFRAFDRAGLAAEAEPPAHCPRQATARQVEQHRRRQRGGGQRHRRVEREHLGGQQDQSQIRHRQQPGHQRVPHISQATAGPFRQRYGPAWVLGHNGRMDLGLRGRVYLVTGGSRGLGVRGGPGADRRRGPGGIRMNGILPVRIATDRVRELDALSGDPDEVRARRSESIPLRRYGEPEEFGRAAAFLLSPAASYITGAMIPVDGGAIRSI